MRRLLVFARKDFLDSVRERQLHVTVVLFLLVGLGVGYLVGSSAAASDLAFPVLLLGALLFLGPLTGIVVSYNALVGKQATGELTVLLGLPFSRADVVLGTLVGRYAVLAVLVGLAATIGAGLSAALGTVPTASAVTGVLLAGLAITLVFVALSVGISANVHSTTRASGLAFGSFLLFVFRLWDALPVAVDNLLARLSLPTLPSDVVELYLQATPHAAVRNLVTPAFPSLEPAFGASVSVPPAGPVLGVVVLGCWIAGPLLLGYYRFARADL